MIHRLREPVARFLSLLFLLAFVPVAQAELNLLSRQLLNYETVSAIDVEDDLAFLATWTTGLRIVDVSDFAHPCEIGSLMLDGHSSAGLVTDIIVHGDVAYAQHSGDEISVVSISDPTHPTILNQLDLGENHAFRMHRAGNLLLVSTYYGYETRIFTLDNPSEPELVSTLPFDRRILSIQVVDSLAFLMQVSPNILWVYDISNPFSPTLVQSNPCALSNCFKIEDGHVFMGDGLDGLQVYTLTDSLSLVETGSCDQIGWPYNIDFHDGYAYIAAQDSGVVVVDVNDPTTPERVARIPLFRHTSNAQVHDDLLWVSDYDGVMRVFDISSPDAPTESLTFPHIGRVRAVRMKDGFAYILQGTGGMLVFDVRTPGNPVLVDSVRNIGDARDMWLDGDLAYVSGGESGVSVLDLSSPGHPLLAGSIDVDKLIVSVAGSNGYIYAGASQAALTVIDVSQPGAMTVVDSLPQFNYASKLYVTGSTLLAGNEHARGATLDLENPAHPEVLYEDLGGIIKSIAVNDSVLYFANSSYLTSCDISDPTTPQYIYSLGIGHSTYNIKFVNNHLFTTCEDGLEVYQTYPDGSFELVDNFPIPWAGDVAIDRDRNIACFATLFELLTLDCSDYTYIEEGGQDFFPLRFTLSPAHPNPFNPSTSMTIRLPRAGHVVVSLYDILGRRVSVLHSGEWSAGDHHVRLDSASLTSGMYVVRAEMDGEANEIQRVVLVK